MKRHELKIAFPSIRHVYDYMIEFTGDITREMDKYRRYFIDNEFMVTYFMMPENYNGNIASTFRYPGATRGHINLKKISNTEYEIINFVFYNDTCFSDSIGCYDQKIETDVEEFIGDILVFPSKNEIEQVMQKTNMVTESQR